MSLPDGPAEATRAHVSRPMGEPLGAHQLSAAEASQLVPRPPSRDDSLRRRLLALADLIGVTIAYVAVGMLDPAGFAPREGLVLLATLPAWVIFNKTLGLYDRDANVIRASSLDELPRIAQSSIIGGGAIFLLGPLVGGPEVDREGALSFIGVAIVVVTAGRQLIRDAISSRVRVERCLLVGSGETARLIAHKLAVQPAPATDLLGYLDAADSEPPHRLVLNAPGDVARRLGDVDDLPAVCSEHEIDRILISLSRFPHERFLELIRISKQLNLKVTVVPGLLEPLGSAVEVEQLGGVTLLGLRGLSRTGSSLLLKRVIDVIASLCALILLVGVLAVIAAAVKLTSRGPVLFAQRRIGRHNCPFRLFKFRTMHRGADERKADLSHLNEAVLPMFKVTADPRLTPIGSFLRRYSLDELPQLWNVLRGEMSLVGPRPLVPDEDNHVVGHHRERLQLTPGLTGPWQIQGRTAIPFEDMVKLDYMYVTEWSLWNDVKLLLRTAPVVLRGTGS